MQSTNVLPGLQMPQAADETDAAIQWIRGMAGIKLREDVIFESKSTTIITHYTPLGVVGAIIPCNFPLLLVIGKIALALLPRSLVTQKHVLSSHREVPRFRSTGRLC
jgi:acyl-CoA reductase-like NAD-dependent aldehyde dehydrogenase